MKILVLGSGGREHALAWKLRQSPKCAKLFIAPGNGGTRKVGQNVDLDPMDFDHVADFVNSEGVSMVVVGPEAPLVAGIGDYFDQNKALESVALIGPSRKGAMLEGSKSFAKKFMHRNNIPTASYREFSKDQAEAANDYIHNMKMPVVLKADGLAAGKGVLICDSAEAASYNLREIFSGKFGKAGEKVVIESFLDGVEMSVFVFTDGKNYVTLPPAKDYKRAGENDTGLNTGGMGAIAPVPFMSDLLLEKIDKQVIAPTIRGIEKEQLGYKGVLYFGLMIVDEAPYVIEYNVRFGDPEAQVVIPLVHTDLVDIFTSIEQGYLNDIALNIADDSAAAVVLASGGYPEKYEKGKIIEGAYQVSGSFVFHAGTKIDTQGNLVTSGGRVMTITSLATTLGEAIRLSNQNAQRIHFDQKYYRGDIGKDVL